MQEGSRSWKKKGKETFPPSASRKNGVLLIPWFLPSEIDPCPSSALWWVGQSESVPRVWVEAVLPTSPGR